MINRARTLLHIGLALCLFVPGILPASANGATQVPREPDPFVRPEFAAQMQRLRPGIIAAAQRHNNPTVSGLTDHQFAVITAVVLFNEHFGWLEDAIPPIRIGTPFYQAAQILSNEVVGTDLTVWPANLRPSVALEILRQELPAPAGGSPLMVPIAVTGSSIQVDRFHDQAALYRAIGRELTDPDLATEYLAANLERGVYRARIEGATINWQTLAAWHNQGIVTPEAIRQNPTALSYVQRASMYLSVAERLIGPAELALQDSHE